jgi:hypothetical protein
MVFKLPLEDNPGNTVSTSEIVKVRCMLEAFKFIELITYCANIFDSKNRFIEVKESGRNPIPLTPNMFKRILRLLTLDKVLKLLEVNSFLDAQGGGMGFLKEFMVQPLVRSSNISEIKKCMLAQPFKQFTWIFAQLVVRIISVYP